MTKEELIDLMSAEHMGDVGRVLRRGAEALGVVLDGDGYGEGATGDWDAVEALEGSDE